MMKPRTIFHCYTVVISFVCLITSNNAVAVNWLMLQGTEHPLAASQKFLGFIQASYTYDTSKNLSGLTDSTGPPNFSPNNGKRLAITSVSPKFDSNNDLQLRRAKFGGRGIFSGAIKNSFTSKMNYLALVEVAPNLMTYDPFGNRARSIALDHLSLTFNHIPGARLRVGLFKTPGPEEALQGVHTLDYIELTDFTGREVVERFVTGAAKPAGSPSSPAMGIPTNSAYGINAVRDWGIQVFDSFSSKQWDLTYAVMLGRGEAIQEKSTSNDKLELYLYSSAEYDLTGGIGSNKNGFKFYGWYQRGEREFSTDPKHNKYDRKRYGIGTKLLGRFFKSKYKYRVGIEMMFAEGMIFISPTGGVANGNINNGDLQFAAENGNRSRGSTFDLGFYPNNKWQFDLRYHQHDLLYQTAASVNPGNERILSDTTLGLNYHFSRKIRLTFNYIFRTVKAPTDYTSNNGFPPTDVSAGISSNVNTLVNTVDDRILLQLTWII